MKYTLFSFVFRGHFWPEKLSRGKVVKNLSEKMSKNGQKTVNGHIYYSKVGQ